MATTDISKLQTRYKDDKKTWLPSVLTNIEHIKTTGKLNDSDDINHLTMYHVVVMNMIDVTIEIFKIMSKADHNSKSEHANFMLKLCVDNDHPHMMIQILTNYLNINVIVDIVDIIDKPFHTENMTFNIIKEYLENNNETIDDTVSHHVFNNSVKICDIIMIIKKLTKINNRNVTSTLRKYIKNKDIDGLIKILSKMQMNMTKSDETFILIKDFLKRYDVPVDDERFIFSPKYFIELLEKLKSLTKQEVVDHMIKMVANDKDLYFSGTFLNYLIDKSIDNKDNIKYLKYIVLRNMKDITNVKLIEQIAYYFNKLNIRVGDNDFYNSIENPSTISKDNTTKNHTLINTITGKSIIDIQINCKDALFRAFDICKLCHNGNSFIMVDCDADVDVMDIIKVLRYKGRHENKITNMCAKVYARSLDDEDPDYSAIKKCIRMIQNSNYIIRTMKLEVIDV